MTHDDTKVPTESPHDVHGEIARLRAENAKLHADLAATRERLLATLQRVEHLLATIGNLYFSVRHEQGQERANGILP